MATPLLVTDGEAARLLSVSPLKVYRLINNGDLERKIVDDGGETLRITYASLQAYVDSLPQDRQSDGAA